MITNLQAISTNDASLRKNLDNINTYGINLNDLNSYIASNNQSINGQVVAIYSSINLKSTGTAVLYTVPAGYKFFVDSIIVESTECTSLSTEAVLSVGANASDYNNLMASETLTGLNAVDKFYKKVISGAKPIITASEVIYLKINTAMTGTSQTANIYLLGLLRGE